MGGVLLRIAEDGTRLFRRYNSKLPDFDQLQELIGGIPISMTVKYEKKVTKVFVDIDGYARKPNPVTLEMYNCRTSPRLFGPVVILLPDAGS